MKKEHSTIFPVSVVVPMRNSSTTVIKTLKSIISQKYPVSEIIVVDNASTDDSVIKVKNFQKSLKTPRIRLIEKKVNRGVGASYNSGVRQARTKYIVCMHSDSILPTTNELNKLTAPIRDDSTVIATFSYILVPYEIWQRYPFWEKCLSATSAGKEKAGLNGKFDCIEKRVFEQIGGFDDVNYGHNIFIGGEDGDLHVRLIKVGRVVRSNARVIHLHSLDPSYSFTAWILNRKLLARSYGRFIRVQWKNLSPSAVLFTVKPLLVVATFLIAFPYNWLLLFGFAIASMYTIYLHLSSWRDPRIILLPFISIFLVFYESFWMLESFLFLPAK